MLPALDRRDTPSVSPAAAADACWCALLVRSPCGLHAELATLPPATLVVPAALERGVREDRRA